MNATICIIIVLVCWNVGISYHLIEHIMETREYLQKLFKFILILIDVIKEIEDER